MGPDRGRWGRIWAGWGRIWIRINYFPENKFAINIAFVHVHQSKPTQSTNLLKVNAVCKKFGRRKKDVSNYQGIRHDKSEWPQCIEWVNIKRSNLPLQGLCNTRVSDGTSALRRFEFVKNRLLHKPGCVFTPFPQNS